MARKKETITLSIPPGTKEQLEAIAAKFQILWGDRPQPFPAFGSDYGAEYSPRGGDMARAFRFCQSVLTL